MMRDLVIAATLLAAVPLGATPAEDELATFLHKKYDKSGGLLTAIIPNAPTGRAADHEGKKADGSYWTSAYFNALNVSTVGWPLRALAKHCARSKAMLVQNYPVRVFDNGTGSFPLKLRDPSGAGDLVIDRWMMERWRYAAWRAEPLQGAQEWDLHSPAGLIDARSYIGLFSCQDANAKPLWHVAILPTRFGNIEALQDVGRKDNAWFMLSIRPVTAATISGTIAEEQAAKNTERALLAASAKDWEREKAVREDQHVKRAAVLSEFRKQLTIGTRTNCGRLLGFNGPLIEVQVPSHIQLRNGATRMFVERDKIEPDDAEAWGCKWD